MFFQKLVEMAGSFSLLVNVQDAQQQRLCTQEASILQMKQELLRASMNKDELNNKNVRRSLPYQSVLVKTHPKTLHQTVLFKVRHVLLSALQNLP